MVSPLLVSCDAVEGYPDCLGSAARGPEHCTCGALQMPDGTPVPEKRARAEAWAAWYLRGGEMCHDCAFRVGSPEEDELWNLAQSAEPFRCHQGMPLDARDGDPVVGNYVPSAVRTPCGTAARQYPVCEGWRRARAALGEVEIASV